LFFVFEKGAYSLLSQQSLAIIVLRLDNLLDNFEACLLEDCRPSASKPVHTPAFDACEVQYDFMDYIYDQDRVKRLISKVPGDASHGRLSILIRWRMHSEVGGAQLS
jgi:hypothetical protein